VKLKNALPTTVSYLLGQSSSMFFPVPFWEVRGQAEETAPLTYMGFSSPPQLLVLSVAQ